MPTILISGAASGLGDAFLRAYQDVPDTEVLAIDRLAVESSRPNVRFFQVDVSSQKSIDTFAMSIAGKPIDLCIHSAGIRGLVPRLENPDDVAICETLQNMDYETMSRTYNINAIGSFMLIRAILPNLRKVRSSKVVVMSSRMGSVANNQHPNKDAGSAYAYRASKAALNMIVRSFAADVQDVIFVLCHPGRVETNLVKSKEDGAITADECVSTVLPLIESWGVGESGLYFDRFGLPIPW